MKNPFEKAPEAEPADAEPNINERLDSELEGETRRLETNLREYDENASRLEQEGSGIVWSDRVQRILEKLGDLDGRKVVMATMAGSLGLIGLATGGPALGLAGFGLGVRLVSVLEKINPELKRSFDADRERKQNR